MGGILQKVQFDTSGLIPAIVQDVQSKEVLMLAYMNREALEKTIETGRTWFYSRSRKTLWNKGETSGNYQVVRQIYYDCDGDTILVKVTQIGNACHTGKYSCFFNRVYGEAAQPVPPLQYLYREIQERKVKPREGSYTNYLFNEGRDKILKKIGEEASEVIIGAKNDNPAEVIYEVADLTYHVLVLLVHMKIKNEDIMAELNRRRNSR